MASWQPIAVGSVLHGRYEIEGMSGRGGFGATYRVRDRERFGQLCALKELLPSQAENPKVRELFEREARTLLALRHAGIPALHAFFSHDDRYYLVEDFVAGRTLAQELEDRGRFTEAEVVPVIDEVLAILEYLHGRTPAVIHRDIKPANIIRAESGSLYLVDFGAVKEAMVAAALSAESTIIGTSGYTPPEQLRGLVVPASDLYAVGAIALHLLGGRSPTEWFDIAAGTWRFAGQLGVSRRLEAVLGGLLEEQLARRFQSAGAVREALRGGSTTSRTRTPLPPLPVPTVGEGPPRRRLVGGAIAGAVVVVAVVTAFKLMGSTSERGARTPPPVASPPPSAPAPRATPAPVTPPAPPPVAAPPSPPPAAPARPAPAVAASPPPAVTPPATTARVTVPPASPSPAPAARSAPEPRAPAGAEKRPPVEARPRPGESTGVVPTAPAPEPPRATLAPAAETAVPAPASPPRPAEVAKVPPGRPAPGAPQRTLPGQLDRVWVTAEQVLKAMGWSIDKRDRGAGILVTESRRLEGDNFGLYAKDVRHRLRLRFTPVDDGRTQVTVERLVFRRERVFWVNTDEPVDPPADTVRDTQIEQAVLAALARAL